MKKLFLLLSSTFFILHSSFAAIPIANFTASNTSLCEGQCISFTDLSTNAPTSWLWSFQGATLLTSTQQNPTNICYNTAGTYFVSLTVSNTSGSNTLYIAGYITVYQSSAINLLVNGDFNNYNTGFTSALTYLATGALTTSQFSIDTNAYYHNGNWAGISPDTTPFFMCDGSQTTGAIVRRDSITNIFPSSAYSYSFLMTNLDVNHTFIMPELRVTVTDQFSAVLYTDSTGLLPAANSNNPPVYVWTPFNFNFSTLPNTTSITITLTQIGGTYLGFDFGLEDVYLKTHFCDSVAAMPDAVLFTDANVFCEGTCIDFNNFSTNATSYQWYFPGGTPSSSTAVSPSGICYTTAGQYDVQLIAFNGGNSDTMIIQNYITVNSLPAAPPITQSGDTLFAPQGYLGYHWYFGSNPIPGATNYFYIATQSGNYNLIITDENYCQVGVGILNVIASVSQFNVESSMLNVFPNPANDNITVTIVNGQSSIVTLEIFNTLGEVVYNTTTNSKSETVNCKHFPSGIYFLRVMTERGALSKKFIKE